LKKHIPNLITCSRLLFLAVIVWLLFNPQIGFVIAGHVITNYHLIALVFFVGAMTDVIDGPLARRWGVESKLGNVLDHAIDKIYILPAVYILWLHLLGPLLIAVLVAEIVVIGIALKRFFGKSYIASDRVWPNWPGKISYGFVAGAAIVVLIAAKWAVYWPAFAVLANLAIGVAILLRLVSFYQYFSRKKNV